MEHLGKQIDSTAGLETPIGKGQSQSCTQEGASPMLIPCLPTLALLLISADGPLLAPKPVPAPLPLRLETVGPTLDFGLWLEPPGIAKAGPQDPSMPLAESKGLVILIEESAEPATKPEDGPGLPEQP
jgi:hypothetical protein